MKTFRVGPETWRPTAEPPKPSPVLLDCFRCGRATAWEGVVDPDAPERVVAHRCTACGSIRRHDKDRPSYWDGEKMKRRRR